MNSIGEDDYFFTKISHIWGWATWRRTWKEYDLKMSKYLDFREQDKIKSIWKDRKVQKYWINIFNEVYEDKINTWDYQLTFSIFLNDRLCISPNFNLVSNIGFGKEFTNTLVIDKRVANLKTEQMIFPIKHPNSVYYDESNDRQINQIYLKNFTVKRILKKIKIFNLIKKIYLYLK